MKSEYRLIVAITNSGYTDLVMDAARGAGADGGTVIKGKGTRPKNKASFFKYSLADEKELVFIVSREDKRKDIMGAIMSKAGFDTDAQTVTFSVPVVSAAGFSFIEPDSLNPEEENAFETEPEGGESL